MVARWKYWTLGLTALAVGVVAGVRIHNSIVEYNETIDSLEKEVAENIEAMIQFQRYKNWQKRCDALYQDYKNASDVIERGIIVSLMQEEAKLGEGFYKMGAYDALFHLIKIHQHEEGVYDPHRKVKIEEDIIMQVEYNEIS